MQAAEGFSLEAQQARIRAFAAVRGGVVVEMQMDVISGYRADNRPGLQRALGVACRERGVLVVCALSRLARSTADAIAISGRLDAAGADLVSLSENIDTTSAAGKMLFRLLSVLAEFERDLISERMKSVLAWMRVQGKYTGLIPYGYDCLDGESLSENQAEQAVIRSMVQMKKRGWGYKRIKEALERRNIPAKRGGKKWSLNAILKILRRAGAVKFPGKTSILFQAKK